MPDRFQLRPVVPRVLVAAAATVVMIASCAPADRSDRGMDTSAGADTNTSGPPRVASGADREAARDADQEFLRSMSDHHQGLIDMAEPAMSKSSTAQAQGDAHRLHTEQQQEQQEMMNMLRSVYGDSIQPTAMPGNRAMNDTLQRRSGTDYDRAFYRMVVDHHREGIAMMDEFRPRVQRTEVRAMIDRMREKQQREIQEFERKQSGGAGGA
jgi:uncharacterized protein (DUF305 family)